ncbi:alpha-2-macroglobulin family protein [Mariniblastus fucicola]|uniref:MG2 domain protein n=1 Tax=Mariniblastus fucicola TaxID=980251 RepID=A0A5B9P4I5_9BACT|nr:MG2 domain-containing protein [Mariniblastus fucicola]QEG21184.1 MG2 domain protein [Mariniblastus fucicola]
MLRFQTNVFVALFVIFLTSQLLSNHCRLDVVSASAVFPILTSETRDDLQKADELFDQQQWSEARTLYESVKALDIETQLHIVNRTITCSMELEEWLVALKRAVQFRQSQRLQIWSDQAYWPQDDHKLNVLLGYIGHLEESRKLLIAIRDGSPAGKRDEFQIRLDEESISLNFELLRALDPDNVRPRKSWGWDTGYERIDWWWEGVQSADADRRYFRHSRGVPINDDQRPAFLKTPDNYDSGLTRAKKILFLLNEIQTLDHSRSKKHLARTLLHRADLNRRLYGPIHDPAWYDAVFYYQYADRPTFGRGRDQADLKPLRNLDDNEARLIVNHKLRVITLPDAESPIAIWRRVERLNPKSELAVEAMYRRALYYQNRRQFSKAKELYQRIVDDFGKHDRAEVAKLQIGHIDSANVLLGKTGVYSASIKPTLWFACRNTAKVEFTARKVDLKAYLVDREKSGNWWEVAYLGYDIFSEWSDDNEELEPFVSDDTYAQWVESSPVSDLVESHSTQAPLAEAGAYVIEARVPGSKNISRGLVIVSGVTIIQKKTDGKVMVWAIDSESGRPLADQKMNLISSKSRHNWKTAQTDSDGVMFFKDEDDSFVFLETDEGDVAFCEIERIGKSYDKEVGYAEFAITDRPLYRPGDEINFRVWTREILDRKYLPAKAGTEVQVHVDGPSYNDRVKTFNLVTDDSGSVSGSFRLNSESPLGEYRLQVERSGDRWPSTASEFRIEEYKKPEFKVDVTPSAETVQLGKPAKAAIKAAYYTGEPVSSGSVKYHVLLRRHTSYFAPPTEWDWLYGVGFGDVEWLYPWLGDQVAANESDWEEDHWRFSWGEEEPAEMISKGEVQLNEDGYAEVVVDTSEFNRDSEYQIEVVANVTDESRRSIKGTGYVVVAPQPFTVFLGLDRGWYQAGDTVALELNARTTNNIGVPTTGVLKLYEILPKDPDDAVDSGESHVFEKRVTQHFDIRTDHEGKATVSFGLPDEGLYRLEFESEKSGQHSASATKTIWCLGPKFDGKGYRFGGLEIIPDKRMYKVGETARILINTSQPNARLLLWDSMDNSSFVDISSHSQVIEIPVEQHHVPNFFVEATVAHRGEVFNEECEIYVPPIDDMLTIEVSPDRHIYRPGQKGNVNVRVTDAEGNPVSGSLALRGYDKSLTYIQAESKTRPKSLVARRRTKYWNDGITSSMVSRSFEVSGRFTCPEFHLEDASEPTAGGMGGAAPSGGDPAGVKSRATSARRGGIDPSTNGYFDSQLAEPEVRSNFADSAIWLPNLKLDKEGSAKAEIKFPESLTTWRIQGFLATGDKTQVGEAVCEVKTKKDFLVRLQSPRFFTMGDEVVLSANVHNNLSVEKNVFAELHFPESIFESVEIAGHEKKTDQNGNRILSASERIKPGETHRFDWPVKVHSSGNASITVKARTDVESDAMQLRFPAFSRTILESQSHSGFFAANETGSKKMEFELPGNVDASKTKLELSFAPTAAGAAFEALPFLAGYPYGCVEQTMSRFYPTVLAYDTLKKLGTDPEALAEAMVARNRKLARQKDRASVFNTSEIERMSQAGLNRLYKFQHKDGGWGWWEHDESSRYMTAYVLLGLNAAADSGVEVLESTFRNGVHYLVYPKANAVSKIPDSVDRRVEQAFIAYVLSLGRSKKHIESVKKTRQFATRVFSNREALNPYGRALLALALQNNQMHEEAETLIGEIIGNIETDMESNMSWMPTSQQHWWRWYNSNVETNAWVLRALVALDSDKSLIDRMANWLVSQRRNGTHWRSTRDSALAVHALSDYMRMMQKESAEDYSIGIYVDGKHVRDVDVSWQNMLALENRVTLTDESFAGGRHQVSLKKDVNGSAYFALTADYETIYEQIPAAQNGGLQISRRYLRRSAAANNDVAKGKPAKPTVLTSGGSLSVGDVVEVELTVSASDDFDYLAFEDPKPAGCEPVRLRSGYSWGAGIASNVELRDSKVIFFVQRLRKGTHVIKYRLRAEVPGTFSGMPATGFAMYAPEINARSEEARIQIDDQN